MLTRWAANATSNARARRLTTRWPMRPRRHVIAAAAAATSGQAVHTKNERGHVPCSFAGSCHQYENPTNSPTAATNPVGTFHHSRGAHFVSTTSSDAKPVVPISQGNTPEMRERWFINVIENEKVDLARVGSRPV